MVKRAIFDFDGTIADSKDAGIKILNDLAPKYGYRPVAEHEHSKYEKMSLKERMEDIGVGYKKLVPLSRDFVREFKKHAAVVSPIPGMVEAMRHLQALGVGISIISSNSTENIKIFLRKQGIDFIDRVIGAKKLFGKEKFIRNELKELGLFPEDAVYIGDEVRDIEASKKAQVKVVAVTWGFDSRPLLEAATPDYIADSPQELAQILM